jgi:tRNA nucleotidyltransferase (CCA-adding enzyme)
MKIYTVGGAVRDALLGRPVVDRDHVVVGATPEELLARGFMPVGRDFPVFLHPETHEEYALARTERKSGHGYHGFIFHAAPDVTLEEDLARRDLTINAMARDEEEGEGRLFDPFNGQADLAARLLRHVGPAFAEDPVRLLRVARFAARLGDFTVAPETLALMRAMTAAGEVDHLTAERVWQEIARGLMEEYPERMFETLRASGALVRLLPEIDSLFARTEEGERLLRNLQAAARRGLVLPARFAVLACEAGERALSELCERLRVPNDCRDLACLAARFADMIGEIQPPDVMVDILAACDIRRRPERFALLFEVCQARRQGECDKGDEIWRQAADACRSMDDGAIAAAAHDKKAIPAHLRAARIATVRAILEKLATQTKEK